MIDYEKLKLAHELAETLSKKNKCSIHIEVVHYESFNPDFILIDWSSSGDKIGFINIDTLIAKLRELKQRKPCEECGYDRAITWHESIKSYIEGKHQMEICKLCHNCYCKEKTPEPKYREGEVVHFLYGGNMHYSEIIGYEWSLEKNCYCYEIKSPRLWWYESELYPTKCALLEAQIEYWSSLKTPEDSLLYRTCIANPETNECGLIDCETCSSLKSEEKSTHSDDVSRDSLVDEIICSHGEVEVITLPNNKNFYFCPICPPVWPKFEGEIKGFDHSGKNK